MRGRINFSSSSKLHQNIRPCNVHVVQFLGVIALQNLMENIIATWTMRSAEKLKLPDSSRKNGLTIPFVIVLSIQTAMVAMVAQSQNLIDIIE